jgi:hypothetical protein
MLKTDTNLEVAGQAATFAEMLELVDSLKLSRYSTSICPMKKVICRKV